MWDFHPFLACFSFLLPSIFTQQLALFLASHGPIWKRSTPRNSGTRISNNAITGLSTSKLYFKCFFV